MLFKRQKVYLANLTERRKIFLFVALLSIVASTLYFFNKSDIELIISGVFILLLLLASTPIWLPEESSAKIFNWLSEAIILVVTTIIKYRPLKEYIKNYIKSGNVPDFIHQIPWDKAPAVIVCVLIIIARFGNILLRDKTGMGKHPDPIGKDIPEPHFLERMKNVCDSLCDDIRIIDNKTNWSARNFVPLDAEVEVQTSNGKKKKITDLLKSIKKSKSRLFLLLGDPGSGKSVSLRKLCLDLSKEVTITQKMPIYINLKEWHVERKWDENNKPSVHELNGFILESLKSRDIVSSRFFDEHYHRLYESGRLYFVLDSFDEIPAVLDSEEKSELIRQLSEVFYKFLKGARNNKSQGILSSRKFRKPTDEFQAETQLEIRPFSEKKIMKVLESIGISDKEAIKALFKERSDLIPVVRNPFMASLLADYLDKNHDQLPINQTDLFSKYIDNTLDSCKEKLQKVKLSKEQVIDGAIKIANNIFSNAGLESKIIEIKNQLVDVDVENIIEILHFTRIGRIGDGRENIFSFSHRRFCEYFAVQKFLVGELSLSLDNIPTDSKWRDALVLYCEVADSKKANEIADFCWLTITQINNPTDLKSLHCLRFIRDAFKTRKECIVNFKDELSEYIIAQLNDTTNIITTKIAVELISLLNEDSINKGLLKAFSLQNEWIDEISIKSCRHISHPADELVRNINFSIARYDSITFIKRYKDLEFSFSLSDAFIDTKRFLFLKLFESLLIITLNILAVLLFPLLFLYYLIDYWIDKVPINRMTRTLPLVTWLMHGSIFFSYLFSTYSLFRPHRMLVFLYLILSVLVFVNIPNQYQILKTKTSLYKYLKYVFNNLLGKMKFKEISYGAIGFLGILVILIGIGYLIVHFFGSNILKNITYAFWCGAFVFVLCFQFGRRMIRRQKVMKQIKWDQLTSREYIYNCFKQMEGLPFAQSRLLDYLELNIKEVSGDWPQKEFLKITQNQYLTRLAKMEEKWLGINE
jgi:hypothetical protein